jgi:hypothetical protein
MSMLATSAGSLNIVTAKLHIPSAGAWRADLLLDHGEAPTGAATVTIGDLSLVGTVLRSGLDAADRPHATVIGGRGWFASVTSPRAFQSDSGVRLSTVLATLAAGAGQAIIQPADRTIGEYYELQASRPGEPVTYSDALNDLSRAGLAPVWRVDPDGVTRFGARTAQAVTGRATLLWSDRGTGLATYGLDAPATWLPGNTVDGASIDRIDIREAGGKLEADVWLTEATAPIRDLVRRMVAHELADQIRIYIVSSCDADTGNLNLVPPPDAQHLPQIRACKQWTIAGARVIATQGTEVLVWMRKRTRPICFAFSGTQPLKVTFGVDSPPDAKPVGLAGGIVNVFFPPTCPVTGMINGSMPFAGTVTFVTDAVGMIADGSKKLQAGE